MTAINTRSPDTNQSDGLEAIVLEDGTHADFAALARFHYQPGRPGAITAVYRLVMRRPTVVGRYLGRADETQRVGVLVRSRPHLACVLREVALQNRYRGHAPKIRAALINRELRTISRVVVEPRFRGLGLAVRLVRHALAHPETVYTEALAAMGRVHPFFERAGMIRYDRPPPAASARLIDAMDRLSIPPATLASTKTVLARLAALSPDERAWFAEELRTWVVTSGATRPPAGTRPEMSAMLARARERLLFQPVYYLAHHP